jgi:hypothetical protein
MGSDKIYSLLSNLNKMVAITLGTGGTFKSPTAEGHLLEICTYLQNQERSNISNSTNKDYVQISFNLNDMTTGISFALPAEQTINETGQIITTASDYLQNITFSPGTNGTFKSSTLSQYFLEVVTYLQIKESNNVSNTQLVNNVTSSYDADDKLFSGSITLPIAVTIDSSGHPLISAVEYLS